MQHTLMIEIGLQPNIDNKSSIQNIEHEVERIKTHFYLFSLYSWRECERSGQDWVVRFGRSTCWYIYQATHACSLNSSSTVVGPRPAVAAYWSMGSVARRLPWYLWLLQHHEVLHHSNHDGWYWGQNARAGYSQQDSTSQKWGKIEGTSRPWMTKVRPMCVHV